MCPTLLANNSHTYLVHQSIRSSLSLRRLSTSMAGDGLRSGHEDKLIDISKRYHKAIGDSNADGLNKLLAPKVVLYSDKVTLSQFVVRHAHQVERPCSSFILYAAVLSSKHHLVVFESHQNVVLLAQGRDIVACYRQASVVLPCPHFHIALTKAVAHCTDISKHVLVNGVA